MNNRLFLMLVLMAAFGLNPVEGQGGAFAQTPVAVINPGLEGSSVVSAIFARPLPADYRVLQAGQLGQNEGNGEFLVLSSAAGNTKVVIVDLEKLSWLKTKEIESANSTKVGKRLLTRFFPEAGPVSVSEDKQENAPSQYAPHLRVTTSQGMTMPAIALRLLYPKDKAYILFLWQQGQVQSYPLAYQQLESQAKTLIAALKVPSSAGTKFSERYMLWRLRHIFKKGLFTHLADPGNEQ